MFGANKNKIFCISMQRTGTTSVGQFFRDNGYKVAGYHRERSGEWSYKRFIGDFEGIFKSKAFKNHQVFEDNPWWSPDFYKFLLHRFPNAKFILLTRDPDKWFDSMINHSNGKTLGNTFRHSKIYRREKEFYNMFPDEDYYKTITHIDNRMDLNETHREHYKAIYKIRNKEIVEFFNNLKPEALFTGTLEDDLKWEKLASFFNIKIPHGYKVHANKSKE